jgi:methyl-accepting chemotaxis protein
MDFGIVDKAEQARYIKDNTTADLHDREYIIQALSGKQAISDVLINRVINRPVIMYAVPITADDSINAPVIGALIGRRDGDHLDAISTQVTYGKSGYAFLMSKTGTIIAHPDASLVLQQFNPITTAAQDLQYRSFGDAVQTAIKGGEGIVEFMYKDQKLVAGYSAMPDFGWTLLVTVEHTEYMTGVIKMRNFVILLVLIFLIVGVSASIILALSITKP